MGHIHREIACSQLLGGAGDGLHGAADRTAKAEGHRRQTQSDDQGRNAEHPFGAGRRRIRSFRPGVRLGDRRFTQADNVGVHLVEDFVKRFDEAHGAGEIHFQHGTDNLEAARIELKLFVQIGEHLFIRAAGALMDPFKARAQLAHTGHIAVKLREHVHLSARRHSGQGLIDIRVQGFGLRAQGVQCDHIGQTLDRVPLAVRNAVQGEPTHQGDADQGQNRESRRNAELQRKWPVVKTQTLEHHYATPLNPSASIWLSPT